MSSSVLHYVHRDRSLSHSSRALSIHVFFSVALRPQRPQSFTPLLSSVCPCLLQCRFTSTETAVFHTAPELCPSMSSSVSHYVHRDRSLSHSSRALSIHVFFSVALRPQRPQSFTQLLRSVHPCLLQCRITSTETAVFHTAPELCPSMSSSVLHYVHKDCRDYWY